MPESNKHGLSRDIPEPIKREVRQRCGFGCINCGRAVYQYEHVDPEFADAKLHAPDRIVLLCGWCHDLVTRGVLSKDTIKIKGIKPKCREAGFSFGPFDIGDKPPELVLGTITARNCKTLIRIHGDDVFSVTRPQEVGQPFILNARFFDIEGNAILDIVENEWRSSSANWDVKVVGQRITIRKSAGDLSLILRTEPPRRIVIERMKMLHKGIRLECWEGKTFEIITPDGSTIRADGVVESDGWEVGIDADTEGIKMGRGGTMRTASLWAGRVPQTVPSGKKTIRSAQTLLAPFQHSPRNAPCPCGSGKKFKHCHGAAP